MPTTIAHESTAGEAGPRQLWKCSDRLCSTEQTYLDRAKNGRKVTSDFFGRNKTATKAIHDDVWHWQCRKGYQVGKYRGDQGTVLEHKNYYFDHLHHQLVRIKLWRPESTFTVQLSNPAKARLNDYHSILRRNFNVVHDAVQQVTVAPKKGKGKKTVVPSLADSVKPDHAEHIDSTFAGEGKTIAYIIDTILPWIDQEFSKGSMSRMPPIEFLINDPEPGETITDPKTNYDRWIAFIDGVSYDDESTKAPEASSSKKRKADAVETSTPPPPPPSKKRKFVLKHTRPKSESPEISPKTKNPSPKIKLSSSSKHQRPPVVLRISRPKAPALPATTSTPKAHSSDPFETESENGTAAPSPPSPGTKSAALSLFRLGKTSPPVPARTTSPDKLPLYMPPAPIKKRAARPALSLDVDHAPAFGAAAMAEYGSGDEESNSGDDESSSGEEEPATPIFAGKGKIRMVYAGGKLKKRRKD